MRPRPQPGIAINAYRMNHGQARSSRAFPTSTGSAATSPGTPARTLRRRPRISWWTSSPAAYPVRQVQVLTPMVRGPAGAGALNALLQAALIAQRDGTPERRSGDRVFRVGDKMIQLLNN